MAKQKNRRKPVEDDTSSAPIQDNRPEPTDDIQDEPMPVEQPEPVMKKAVPAKKVQPRPQDVKVNVIKPQAKTSNRRLLFGIIGLAVAILVLVPVLILSRSGKKAPAAKSPDQDVVVRPTAPRLLDGTPTDPNTVARWPIAIMFDNLPAARPQSAISLARIVYETLAEGGTTRFMGIFDGSENPGKIGPVRSSRHYFVRMAEEYQAAYAHAGASPQAYELLQTAKVTDLNMIGSAAKYAYRDKSRQSPHNLYTDDKLLTRAMHDKDLLEKKSTIESWPFVPEPVLADRPTAPMTISVKFSSLAYEAGWRYNREANLFERTMGGVAHVDALNNQPVLAKTVVVMMVPAEKSLGEKGRIDIDLIGEGKALVFKDGIQVEGTWKRPTAESRTKFFDAAGLDIPFHPGTIWIEVVPGNRQVVVTNS